MKKSFETEATVAVEVEGFYKSPTAVKFSHAFGNYLPGDHDDASNVKVFINVNGQRFEITAALTQAEKDSLESHFLESCREDQLASIVGVKHG